MLLGSQSGFELMVEKKLSKNEFFRRVGRGRVFVNTSNFMYTYIHNGYSKYELLIKNLFGFLGQSNLK